MEIIVNDKTTVMETLEQFLESLYQRYVNLTKQDFNELIMNVGKTYKQVGDEDPYSDLAYNIAKTCWKSKEMTFKQWQVMNTFVHKNTSRSGVKKFN